MGTVCSGEEDGVLEVTVCSSEEVPDSKIIEKEIEGNKIILTRQGGQVRAFSGTCTHYGAPLVKGDLGENVIRCPWHGACFNATTGDIEDFPGLSSLACYTTIEKEGRIVVRAKRDLLEAGKRDKIKKGSLLSNDTVVVVGGGAAGHTATETLRSEGFGGKLIMITKESTLPYDRPKLSKKLDSTSEEILLRDHSWYASHDVEVHLDTIVTGVDPDKKIVVVDNGKEISYTHLLIATGGSPRMLGIPGEDLTGVLTLRSPGDANYIHGNSEGKHVVIIGGSFIGMEVAAAIVDRAASVTVVDRNSFPFQAALGDKVGAIMQELHKEKGVKFLMNEALNEFLGDGGSDVKKVRLASGTEIQADLVLMAVGVVPATQFLSEVQELQLERSGHIPVDQHMATRVEGIWAAGDIVRFPLVTFNNEAVSIGHWGLAMKMGKTAALNILGKKVAAKTVPFFWTVQFGKSIRFAGQSGGSDSVELERKEDKFIAVYGKDGMVRGVATLGRDPVAANFANLVLDGKSLPMEDAMRYFNEIAA